MFHVGMVPVQSNMSPRTSSGLYEDTNVEEAGDLIRRTYPIVPGQRMATPDKEAIMDLAASFERRKLGKAQRVLHSMAERAREQEIAEMSTSLCRHATSHERGATGNSVAEKIDGSTKGKSSSTSVGESSQKSADLYFPAISSGETRSEANSQEKRGSEQFRLDKQPSKKLRIKPRNFNGNIRSNNDKGEREELGPIKSDHFPARKVIKPRSRYYMPLQPKPHMAFDATSAFIQYQKGVSPHDKTKLLRTRKINGPIQLDLYLHPRPDQLAPLIKVPSMRVDSLNSRTTESYSSNGGPSPDRVDAYMHTGKVTIGKRNADGDMESRLSKTGSIRNDPPRKSTADDSVESRVSSVTLQEKDIVSTNVKIEQISDVIKDSDKAGDVSSVKNNLVGLVAEKEGMSDNSKNENIALNQEGDTENDKGQDEKLDNAINENDDVIMDYTNACNTNTYDGNKTSNDEGSNDNISKHDDVNQEVGDNDNNKTGDGEQLSEEDKESAFQETAKEILPEKE